MSKAILVLKKMPKVCGECDYFKRHYVDEKEEMYSACALTGKIIDIDFAEKHRSVFCPLKPMPRKKYKKEKRDWYNYASPYLAGWNECIEEIIEVENE